MAKKLTKVLLFVLLFFLHLILVTGGTLYASLGLYALLGGSPLTDGIGTANAWGCLMTGLLIALASFALSPRALNKVVRW